MKPKLTTEMWGRGLRQASDLLIKRGTAMGALIPLLFLVPIFLSASWLFGDNPVLSFFFGLAAVGIVIEYCRHYSRFAKNDPDRLQSEEYRYEMTRIHMVAAKELPHPISVEDIPLADPTSNPTQSMPTIKEVEERLDKINKSEAPE